MKIGMFGAVDEEHKIVCGQSDKTELFYNSIREAVGDNNIRFVNTFNWRNKMISKFASCLLTGFTCRNVILMTSVNGIKFLYPFLGILKIFGKNIYHVVVGGEKNIELVHSSKLLRSITKKMDGLYVEIPEMINEYEKLGIKRVSYVPNFKSIDKSQLQNRMQTSAPFSFCVYSRINKIKGIPDAISAVMEVNRNSDEKCTLDIYGTVEPGFESEFDDLLKKSKECVRFCGRIERKQSRQVLGNYFAMLFPTHHQEGIPGGVIDSFEAGLPIIACNSHYISSVISDGVTGILYPEDEKHGLTRILQKVIDSPEIVNNMRKNCLIEAVKYDKANIISNMLSEMNLR